jgi:hypothetical protein
MTHRASWAASSTNVVGDLVARGKIHAAALEHVGRVLLESGYCPSSSSGMP